MYLCTQNMMLELHNVTIGQQIHSLSLTVNDGQALSLKGAQGSGKTTLLRAVVGLIPVDEGHISIDGELLTPKSAPFFRRQMAYVPQRLLVPEDYTGRAPQQARAMAARCRIWAVRAEAAEINL